MVEKHFPGRQFERVKDLKERFDEINVLVTAKGGWVTSIRGAPQVTIETLPESTIARDLAGLGYVVTGIGCGERILPLAIKARVLIEGSTVPMEVTHAGVCRVERFILD